MLSEFEKPEDLPGETTPAGEIVFSDWLGGLPRHYERKAP